MGHLFGKPQHTSTGSVQALRGINPRLSKYQQYFESHPLTQIDHLLLQFLSPAPETVKISPAAHAFPQVVGPVPANALASRNFHSVHECLNQLPLNVHDLQLNPRIDGIRDTRHAVRNYGGGIERIGYIVIERERADAFTFRLFDGRSVDNSAHHIRKPGNVSRGVEGDHGEPISSVFFKAGQVEGDGGSGNLRCGFVLGVQCGPEGDLPFILILNRLVEQGRIRIGQGVAQVRPAGLCARVPPFHEIDDGHVNGPVLDLVFRDRANISAAAGRGKSEVDRTDTGRRYGQVRHSRRGNGVKILVFPLTLLLVRFIKMANGK